jgi:hypothetical protein
MSWLFKTASAATFSLFLVGTVNAQPADPAAAVAAKKASFDHLSFSVRQMTLQGSSTNFNIDKDGNYTITTDGGMAHFIMIRAQGKLSASQLQSLENSLAKMSASGASGNLPGLVPGSPEFTISYESGGKTKTVSGAWNTKGAIEEAKQNGQDVSAWKTVAPFVNKFNLMETALEKAYNPTAPAPDKKPAFDELSIEERNSWTGGVDKLTIDKDGTYKLERSLGQSTLTGKLTKAQLDAIVKAYDHNTLAADNGKLVGQVIPDDTMFTITSKEGGNTYKVNGSVDATTLGPLQALEKVLVGDVNSLQPPVAKPLVAKDANKDQNAKDQSAPKDESLLGRAERFFGGAWDSLLGNKDAVKAAATADNAGRPSRTAGMGGLLADRVVDGSAKADGKDAAADGK